MKSSKSVSQPAVIPETSLRKAHFSVQRGENAAGWIQFLSGHIHFLKSLYYYLYFACTGSPFRRSGRPFLQSPGSGAQGRQLRLGVSCPVACGMLVPYQGSKLCPLHGKGDCQPLDHQGHPRHIHLMTTSYGGFPENSSG